MKYIRVYRSTTEPELYNVEIYNSNGSGFQSKATNYLLHEGLPIDKARDKAEAMAKLIKLECRYE
jgi:hypothetical protein